MVEAIVSIEDDRFYKHGALDIRGTIRAFVTNQASGSVQGGSSITQQMVKQTLLNQAETEERGGRGDRRHLRPQAPRAALRHRVREELLQGLDPRALPQHRLLRRRRLRHPGGGPALLRQERQEPQLPPVRHAGRPGEEPHRLRPDQLAGALDQPAQRRARPDGAAQRHPAGAGRQAEGAQARPQRREVPQRLPAVAGAVLLRLRRQLPPQGQVARRDGQGPQAAAPVRRPDDPHDDRPRLPGRRRRGRPEPRRPDRRRHRRPGDGPARHRLRPGAGAVATDGQEQGGGRDLPQLRRACEVRRRQRLPGRLDVQGVRAGRGDQPEHPAQRVDLRADRDDHPRLRVRDLRRPLLRRRRLERLQLDRRRQELQPLHRHPGLGEHLLRPARDRDRHVRADRARAEDGHHPARRLSRSRPGSSASPTPTR